MVTRPTTRAPVQSRMRRRHCTGDSQSCRCNHLMGGVMVVTAKISFPHYMGLMGGANTGRLKRMERASTGTGLRSRHPACFVQIEAAVLEVLHGAGAARRGQAFQAQVGE